MPAGLTPVPPVGRRSTDSITAPDGSEIRLVLHSETRRPRLQHRRGEHRARFRQQAGAPPCRRRSLVHHCWYGPSLALPSQHGPWKLSGNGGNTRRRSGNSRGLGVPVQRRPARRAAVPVHNHAAMARRRRSHRRRNRRLGGTYTLAAVAIGFCIRRDWLGRANPAGEPRSSRLPQGQRGDIGYPFSTSSNPG